MHLLDFGCGVGDVTLMAARLVGSHGSVTGVDMDADAPETVKQRAEEEGLEANVHVLHRDLNTFQTERRYDAVIGRLVLVHSQDPVSLIRRAATLVHPGGIVAFQDYDIFFREQFDNIPLWNTCANAVSLLFQKAGLPLRAGAYLFRWFLEAGLPTPECRLETPIEGGEATPYYELLAESIRSLSPKMLALGILQPGQIDLDQLAQNLRTELTAARQPCLTPSLGGAFVRTPVVTSSKTSN